MQDTAAMELIERLLSAPEVHLAVCMYIGVSHGLATFHEEYLHFRRVPSQHREVNSPDGREEIFASDSIIHAY